MSVRALKLAGAALMAAALLAPTAANAQYHGSAVFYYAGDRGHGHDRADDRGRDRAGYLRDDERDDRRSTRRADYPDRRARDCDQANAGTILGAIAGGLLGNGGGERRGNRSGRGPGGDRDCN